MRFFPRGLVVPFVAGLMFALGCPGTETITESEQIEEEGEERPPLNVNSIMRPEGAALDSPPLDTSLFPLEGDTEFFTAIDFAAPPSSSECTGGACGAPGESGGGCGGGSILVNNTDTGDTYQYDEEVEPDLTREIVEADIFHMEGDLLYILNAYRGLLIFDLSDLDSPVRVGRLAIKGKPVEMYVREGRVYFMLSDHFQYWMYDNDADPLGFHGSRVLIADVSNPADPFLLGAVRVDGEITDSRMVGDVLYVVSKRNPEYWRYNTVDWKDRTWVISMNIADPANIQEIDRVTFEGTSTLIHVAHHAVFVAALDPNYYLYDSENSQETKVTYVDISDAGGALGVHGDIYVPGVITDRFKMDWHDHAFRVISQLWRDGRVTEVSVFDTNQPDDIVKVGNLSIPEETYGALRATRFDAGRAFAEYRDTRLIDDRNTPVDTLVTMDLTDPRHPSVAGDLEIRGYITHFQTRDDRLLALGQDHYYDGQTYAYRAKLSLFDVSDIATPTLLSDAELGFGTSSSQANQDYKAFKVLDDLILAPVNWRVDSESHSGTQLVDWMGDALTARGAVDHPGWQVRRVFPAASNHVVALSEQTLQVIDASDRAQPSVAASVHLLHTVTNIFEVDGKQVQVVTNTDRPGTRVEVIDFGRDDDGPVLATLELPFTSAPTCFRDGDFIRMIGFNTDGDQIATSLDVSAPLSPRQRGTFVFPDDVQRIYSEGSSFYSVYWSLSAGLPMENRLLPVTLRAIVERADGRRDFISELRIVDMTDPDNPTMTDGSIPMNEWPFVNKVTHGTIIYSTHLEDALTAGGERLAYHAKSIMDRIDVSDPTNPRELPSVNIPGYLIDVSDDGNLIYTVDYQWDEFGRRRNSFNVLALEGGAAVLKTVIPVQDLINRSMLRDRVLWMTTHKYPWWGMREDSVESRQPYTLLCRVEFAADGAIADMATAELHGYHLNLLDQHGSSVFLSSSNPKGVLVLNVGDPDAPDVVTSSRTIGYVSRVVFAGDHIYMPLGSYGVHRIESP